MWAFEAHPDNASMLRKTVSRNRLEDRIVVENVAVLDRGSRSRVSDWRRQTLVKLLDDRVRRRRPGYVRVRGPRVPSTSIDEYLGDSTEPVSVVKIDVEGALGPVLSGMSRLIERCRPVIVAEVHDSREWAAIDALRVRQYRLRDVDAGSWLDVGREQVYHCAAWPVERILSE